MFRFAGGDPHLARRTDGYLFRSSVKVKPECIDRGVRSIRDSDVLNGVPIGRRGANRFVCTKQAFAEKLDEEASQSVNGIVDSADVFGYTEDDGPTRFYGNAKMTRDHLLEHGKIMPGRFSVAHPPDKIPELELAAMSLRDDFLKAVQRISLNKNELRHLAERGMKFLQEFCSNPLLDMEKFNERTVSHRRAYRSDLTFLTEGRETGHLRSGILRVSANRPAHEGLLSPRWLSVKQYPLVEPDWFRTKAEELLKMTNDTFANRPNITDHQQVNVLQEANELGFVVFKPIQRLACANNKEEHEHLFNAAGTASVCCKRCTCGTFHTEPGFCAVRDRDDYQINDALLGVRASIAAGDCLNYPDFPVCILDAETGAGKSTKCIINLAKNFPKKRILVATTRRDAAKNGYEHVKSCLNISATVARDYIFRFQQTEFHYFELKRLFQDLQTPTPVHIGEIEQERRVADNRRASGSAVPKKVEQQQFAKKIPHELDSLISRAKAFLVEEKELELLQYTVAFTVGERESDINMSPNYDSRFGRNRIVYATDGWVVHHPDVLDSFDIVVVDEAHDLTAEKEVLLSMIRQRIANDKEMRDRIFRSTPVQDRVSLYESRIQSRIRYSRSKNEQMKARKQEFDSLCSEASPYAQLPLNAIIASATLSGPKQSDVDRLPPNSAELINASVLGKIANFFNSKSIGMVRCRLQSTQKLKHDSFVVFTKESDRLYCPKDVTREKMYELIEVALMTIKTDDFGVFSFQHLLDKGILIFVPTKEDCYLIAERLRDRMKILAVPYCAGMDSGWRQFVFNEKPLEGQPSLYRTWRVIIATNVAESALTIPDLGFMVDTGLVIRNSFNPELNCQEIVTERCSQSEMRQRVGRVGRTGDGVSLLMYSRSEIFNCRIDVKNQTMTEDKRNLFPLLSRKFTVNGHKVQIMKEDFLGDWTREHSPIPTITDSEEIEKYRDDILIKLDLAVSETNAPQIRHLANRFLFQRTPADIVPLCNWMVTALRSESKSMLLLFTLARSFALSRTLLTKIVLMQPGPEGVAVRNIHTDRDAMIENQSFFTYKSKNTPDPSPYGDLDFALQLIRGLYYQFRMHVVSDSNFAKMTKAWDTTFFQKSGIERNEVCRLVCEWERQHRVMFATKAKDWFDYGDFRYSVMRYTIDELGNMGLDEAICRLAQAYYARKLHAKACLQEDEDDTQSKFIGTKYDAEYRGIGVNTSRTIRGMGLISITDVHLPPMSTLLTPIHKDGHHLSVKTLKCFYPKLTFDSVINLNGKLYFNLAMQYPEAPFTEESISFLSRWPQDPNDGVRDLIREHEDLSD